MFTGKVEKPKEGRFVGFRFVPGGKFKPKWPGNRIRIILEENIVIHG